MFSEEVFYHRVTHGQRGGTASDSSSVKVRHSLPAFTRLLLNNILSIFIVNDENYKFFGSEESFKSIDQRTNVGIISSLHDYKKNVDVSSEVK